VSETIRDRLAVITVICASRNMRRLGKWILELALAAAPAWGQQYPFLPLPGSPPNVSVLMQDSRSAVWVGTDDEALLFDGERSYSLRPYGFPKERVAGFAEDVEGGIWIATAATNTTTGGATGGLYRYQNGNVQQILAQAATSVVSADPNTMFASIKSMRLNGFADLYIFRRSQGIWQGTLLLKEDADFLSIDHDGTLLFHCREGWCELSKKQIAAWPGSPIVPNRHPFENGNLGVGRVIRDRFNCLWFRGDVSTWYQCPNQHGLQPIKALIGPYGYSDSMSETSEGSMLSLQPGLALVRGPSLAAGDADAIKIARGSNGLPTDVGAAIPLRDGSILLGTSSGLYKFMYPFRLEYWKQEDGVDAPFSILRAGDKVLASNHGIQTLDATRSKWIPWSDGSKIGGTTVHMIPGPGGTIYAASIERGVTQHDLDGRILAATASGQGGARLAVDAEGHTWLAGTGVRQVSRVGAQLQLGSKGMNESGDSSLDLEYDQKHGALWACHGHEVVVRHNGEWRHITRQDGLLGGACLGVTVVPNGDAWVGYGEFSSFSKIRTTASGQFQVETVKHQRKLPDGGYGFLRADARGWLWSASEGEDEVALPDAATHGNWLQLDAQDGLPEPGGNQNSLFPDTDGSVWFASGNTITHFNPPNDLVTSFPAPELFFAGLSIGSAPQVLTSAVGAIPHGESLVAHIGSSQFEHKNALRLRYRLLPSQTEWKESGNLDLALGELMPGSYTLQVQDRMLTGPWSVVQSQTLRVLWPIWLTWPFLLGYLASGSTLAYGGNRWSKYQRSRRNLVLPDLSLWRNAARSPETAHLIGTAVDGRYEIGHILSVGGFATVARACDLQRDGRLCAVKIFRYELAGRDWIRHRFQHEVAALEQLDHPNIVRITGHGTVDTGAPYLVMDFIQGSSLRELLEGGALPKRTIARFLRQIGSALAALHHESIYHRDLKPENLMIRKDEQSDDQFVLIDFSIAIVKSPDHTFHGISRVAGTLGYMAPEQVTGYADASTDIHSLAKVVLEMLTGKRCSDLFPEATLDLPDHVHEYFARATGIFTAPSIELIACAVAFDPVHRPHDVEQFAAPLIRDLEGLS